MTDNSNDHMTAKYKMAITAVITRHKQPTSCHFSVITCNTYISDLYICSMYACNMYISNCTWMPCIHTPSVRQTIGDRASSFICQGQDVFVYCTIVKATAGSLKAGIEWVAGWIVVGVVQWWVNGWMDVGWLGASWGRNLLAKTLYRHSIMSRVYEIMSCIMGFCHMLSNLLTCYAIV